MLLRFIYTLLLTLVAPFFLYGLYKAKVNKPKFGRRWQEHFGFTPKINNTTSRPIWFHTVSVGEAIAATPIIQALKKDNPTANILVTTTTSTGAAQIAKLADIVTHRYMPLDLPFAIKGFLRSINPSAMLIMETELWPNTLHYVSQAKIPITVINARLSERSCLRYQKFQRIFDLLGQNIDHLLCQNEHDAQRFLRLGIKQEKIHITGSVKFDISLTAEIKESGLKLKALIAENRPVWIAASTHKGEDEHIIQAHKQLLLQKSDALLIIVPRHPERFDSVAQLCRDNKLSVISRSSQNPVTADTQVYLGDTMGEMLTLIGAADICFMAGSLLGDKVGGHNVLEPAALAKPILCGPSYYNFQQITEALISQKACTICQNSEQIQMQLLALFNSPEKRQEQGRQALKIVNENRGALQKTLDYINRLALNH